MSIKTLRPYQLLKINNFTYKKQRKSPISEDEITRHSTPERIRKPAFGQKASLPIPKGETPYALAKSAEYHHRDLDLAEYYYNQAIIKGDRIESAVKDLASLLHQRGKTKQACEILEKYRHIFKYDYEKYTNLYNTLKKQIDSTGNCQNKCLKISNLNKSDTQHTVISFFNNSIRIQKITLHQEDIDGKIVYYGILKFNSHSSARKTLEGFHHWDTYKVEWVSPAGDIAGDAHYARHKMEEYRKHHPTFDYMIFDRDPHGYVYSLPIDQNNTACKNFTHNELKSAEKLLGSNLYITIFEDDDVFKDI
ncbi:hypothetical protein SteCoe_16334 [Stentor coeruleus]|uniref:RRM domain-containing protein n=1 Tax=Stentor coeruleus TaxID=5963 RepID=A0A1R2C1K5_9CILI|nr:hypothetical protein SteCoe_16334 [Stentor coeruleus]